MNTTGEYKRLARVSVLLRPLRGAIRTHRNDLRSVAVGGLALLALACAAPESELTTLRKLQPILRLGGSEADQRAVGPELLYKPSDIAIDERRNIYVMDGGNYRVAVFGPDGTFLREFGRPGQGPGEFSTGRYGYLAISKDSIAVLEQTREKIQLFSLQGDFQTALASQTPIGSVALAGSNIYAYELGAGGREPGIQIYSLDGTLVRVAKDDLVIQSRDPAHLYALNASAIAATEEGLIAQAYLHWPLLRVHRAAGEWTDHWLEFDWLPPGDLRSRVQRPDTLLTDPDVWLLDDEMSPIVFYDIDHAAGPAEWVTLLYADVVQVFTEDGEPVETIKLALPVPSNRDAKLRLQNIAVDPSGTFLCGLEYFEGGVFCYDRTRVARVS
jgi:hypothetical protein